MDNREDKRDETSSHRSPDFHACDPQEPPYPLNYARPDAGLEADGKDFRLLVTFISVPFGIIGGFVIGGLLQGKEHSFSRQNGITLLVAFGIVCSILITAKYLIRTGQLGEWITMQNALRGFVTGFLIGCGIVFLLVGTCLTVTSTKPGP